MHRFTRWPKPVLAACAGVLAAIESAESFGTLTCSVPFGVGVQHDTSTVTRMSTTAGSFAGGVKLVFNIIERLTLTPKKKS